MEIRRFKDIIAIKDDAILGPSGNIVAFHSSNMEVAAVTEEVYGEMSKITLTTGEIPTPSNSNSEPLQALNEWNNEINSDAISGVINFGIQSITLNVNQICNLKCAYCAAGGDGTYGEPVNQLSVEKTLPQLRFFMSKLKPGSTFAISFVGGEPLLHPQAIKAIYDFVIAEAKVYKINPKLKIVTNGTLINEKTLEILRSMKIHLTISIDGTKASNDLNRPSKDGKSTTDKIVKGLNELASDRGQLQSINFSSITTKQNSNIFENYLYLKTLAPDSMEFVFANDEKDVETQNKHIQGLELILANAWASGGEAEIRKIKSVNHYFHVLDNQQKTENFCGAGKNYLMVDSKNRLYSCVWDANYKEEVVGHDSTMDMEKLSKLSKPLIDLNNCRTCWARFLCGGGCMHINRSSTGNKHQKSLLFCERTRSLISLVIMYYKLARTADA